MHNTVAVANRDQMTRAGCFLWVDWAQAESTKYHVSKARVVEAWHDGYSRIGVHHRRAVLYSEQQDFWIVVDDVPGKIGPRSAAALAVCRLSLRVRRRTIANDNAEGRL